MVEFPRKIPVNPPDINKLTKPIANNIPTEKRILPRHNVVSQLNTFMADGTAISNVSNTKMEPSRRGNVTVDITFKHYRAAEIMAYLPMVTRTTSHTIRFVGRSILEVSRFLEFVNTYQPDLSP